VIVGVFAIFGCADDSTPGPVTAGASSARQGRFLDSAVEGLAYRTGSGSGITEAHGTFLYEKGSIVSYSIGGIVLGQGRATFIMTPVDLVGLGLDENDSTVTNIVRFLMTLDDDGDSFSNNIVITGVVRDSAASMSIDFDQSIAAFESDPDVLQVVSELTAATSAGVRPLVSVRFAQFQLQRTLRNILGGTYSGTYHAEAAGDEGKETGPVLGTWIFVVFPFGSALQLGGVVIPTGGEEMEITGFVNTDGSFESLILHGMSFVGTIEIDDEDDAYRVSGRWFESAENTGTFSGIRE
jgi:hypothetical protein